MNDSAPQTREQYSAHIPALHLPANLGWRYLTAAQYLSMRGSNREVLLKQRLIEVLQSRRFDYKGERYPLSPNAIDQIVRELSARDARRTADGQRAAVQQAGPGHHRHRVHRRQEAPADHPRDRLGRP